MPKRYAPEFRRAVCARLVAGEEVCSLSKELGVSEATLYARLRSTRGVRGSTYSVHPDLT